MLTSSKTLVKKTNIKNLDQKMIYSAF